LIKRVFHILPLALVVAACVSSKEIGPYAPTAEDRNLELAAIGKLQCAWENQTRCAHMIENRTLFGRIFSPETVGGLKETEKLQGRRATTKFIVEATAAINQCRPVAGKSVIIVKDVRLAKKGYRVEGTSPLSDTSSCFLAPDPENP